jgi:hypothetical protein
MQRRVAGVLRSKTRPIQGFHSVNPEHPRVLNQSLAAAAFSAPTSQPLADMGDTATIVVSSGLVLLALALLGVHWNSWRKADHGGLAEREREFYRRQFRRRILSSGMLGLAGLMMLSSQWVETSVGQALLWIIILLAMLAVLLLATADWWSTRMHFVREEVDTAVQIELLKAEIRKFEEGGGKEK